MTGYVDGSLTDPEGADALLASAERSVAASRTLGTPNLNLHGTGLDPNGLPVHPVETVTGAMWLAAVETLGRIADLGKARGRGLLAWRTSTPPSTTPVRRSRAPRTPPPWSRPSTAPTCG